MKGDFTTTKEVHNDTYPAIDPKKCDLTGKSVYIAGASKGIGMATAVSFAKAGASQIAIGARSDLTQVEVAIKDAAKAAGRKEPQVVSVKVDVTDPKSVDAAVKVMDKEFGKLDVVIHNAGIISHGLIGESDPEEWMRTLNVNVGGPYLTARYCLPLLTKSELKTMVTVSSVGAHAVLPTVSVCGINKIRLILSTNNAQSYQISKLAVLRLMEFFDTENKEHGIVAYSIHPGNILTDIVNRGEGMAEQFKSIFTETTELPADTLTYLCNEKRDWLSGRYVNVTWDMPELTSSPKKDDIIERDLLRVRMAL